VEPSTSRPARFALAIFSPLPRAFLISPRKDPFSARKWVHDFFPEPPPGPAQSVVTSSTASPLDCTLQSANATHCDCLCPPTHLRHDSYHRPAAVVRTCPPDLSRPFACRPQGEEDAYFYARRLGHVLLARNFCSLNRHGEIDLIGTLLCRDQITYNTRGEARRSCCGWLQTPGTVCLSPEKYLRHLPPSCPWRLEVVSVLPNVPATEVFQNVSLLA
jgi:hypothetical protein